MTAFSDPDPRAGFAPHPLQDRSRKALFGMFWSLLHTLIPSVSAALIFLVSAANLAPVDFGHLAMAAAAVSVALAFSPIAFGEALVQRAVLRREHADAVFWLTALIGTSYCLLLWFTAPLVALWFSVPELSWLIPFLSFKVPFEMLAVVPSAMIVRSMSFRLIALRTAISAGFAAVLSIGLLFAGYGVFALVLSQVAASLTTCVVAFWTSGWRPQFTLKLTALRDIARYGLFSSGQRLLVTLRLDHLVAGAMAGPVVLGLLVFAQRLFRLLSDVAGGALSSVLHVVLASMQGEPDKIRKTFDIASFGAAALGFPVFIGAALVIDDLVALVFPETWGAAAEAAQLYCVVGLFATLSIVQGALIRSQGKPDWMFWYQLGQEAMTVLTIAATWRFGLEGMVTAIVVKTFLLWPISVVMTLRLLGNSLGEYLLSFLGPLASALFMAFVLWMLPDVSGATGLAMQIAVGVAVYPPILYFICRTRIRDAWQAARSKGRIDP